ncbi:MAG: tryptophan-rich sensory protein [Firmicutes bacterium]|nr:tryptophan-rich sensory protein [Bacillota bacterium]
MKVNYKKLILIVLGTFLIGGFFSFFIPNSRGFYSSLEKPPLSPPGILFPIAWSILYILMGVSLYIVSESDIKKEENYLIYIIQLVVNSLWTLLFFGFNLQFLSFLWILLLIVLVVVMIVSFYQTNKVAGLLQIPYLLWLVFAAYLNLGIYILNR